MSITAQYPLGFVASLAENWYFTLTPMKEHHLSRSASIYEDYPVILEQLIIKALSNILNFNHKYDKL
jgi:hypothetical protein